MNQVAINKIKGMAEELRGIAGAMETKGKDLFKKEINLYDRCAQFMEKELDNYQK